MFGFIKSNKTNITDTVDFNLEQFKSSLIKSGVSEEKATEISEDVSESMKDRVIEKTTMTYDTFMNSVISNVEGLSTLPTERIQACAELTNFLSESPEVNNSIRLYASYIAYGSAETKLEEYKVNIIGVDQDKIDRAKKEIKKWEHKSKIRRTIYPVAKDLIPFGDAFLEKLYVDINGNKKLIGVAYIPSNTMYPKINSKGYPIKYYQIINKVTAFADNNETSINSMIQEGSVIEFNTNEIIHFSDGSAIGVTDTPYYNLIILWRYLKMLEESLVIHRMTRARRFIIFFLDVTGKTKIEIRSAVSNFTQRIKSIFKLDVKGGIKYSNKSTVPSSSDLVIPITKDSATKVQNIPSDLSASKTDDINFYLNRITTNMFTSHVFRHSQQLGNEKYIEKSFMRLVKIYQRQMEYVLEDIYDELLIEKGYTDLEVKIQFPSPDAEQEIRLVDSIVRRMMIINQLTATIGTTPPTEWIVKYVFKDLSQYEIDELINMLNYAIKKQEEEQNNEEYPSIFDENQSTDTSLRDQSTYQNNIHESINNEQNVFSEALSLISNTTSTPVTESSNINNRLNDVIKMSLDYLRLMKSER